MPKSKPYTTLSDERTGRWTNVEFHDDQLVFVRTGANTHWIAKSLGAIICLVLCVSLFQTPMGILFFGGLVCLAIWHLVSSKFRQSEIPIVISRNPIKESDVSTFHVNDIRRFLIRENQDRDRSEDDHLLQIYMELRNQERLVLLYQDYFAKNRNQDTREIFEHMLSWLKNAK